MVAPRRGREPTAAEVAAKQAQLIERLEEAVVPGGAAGANEGQRD